MVSYCVAVLLASRYLVKSILESTKSLALLLCKSESEFGCLALQDLKKLKFYIHIMQKTINV